MTTQNRIKDIVKMVHETDGLTLVKHYLKDTRACAEVRAENGVTRLFSISTSGRSDVRGDQIASQKMRRFARENAKPETNSATAKAEPARAFELRPHQKQALDYLQGSSARRTITLHQKAVLLDTPVMTITLNSKTEPMQNQQTEQAAATPIRELTRTEFFKLCEWTKAQGAMTAHTSLAALTAAAAAFFDQQMSEDTLREAMEATGIEEPEHWTPLEDSEVILARELKALMESLGNKPSAQFTRLLATLNT
jgi:hypothetical protein